MTLGWEAELTFWLCFSLNHEIETVGVDLCGGCLEICKSNLSKEAINLVLADAVIFHFRKAYSMQLTWATCFTTTHIKFLLNPNGAIIFEEPSVESKGEALEKKSAPKIRV